MLQRECGPSGGTEGTPKKGGSVGLRDARAQRRRLQCFSLRILPVSVRRNVTS